MSALDQLIPTPRLLEIDHVDVAAPPPQVWDIVRHADLGRSPLIHALFAIRSLPARLAGHPGDRFSLRLDDLTSTPDKPGFRILIDDPPREVALGAIGKVWEADIPFLHMADAGAFAAFGAADYAKVAWAIRVVPLDDQGSRVEIEVRVDATDDAAWEKFGHYFRLIGIGSHFIRRIALAALAKELGVPAAENERRLDGDELLPDAAAQDTRAVTIATGPDAIWPWLLQMGSGRGGFYSIDLLDNAGDRSARELHPELSRLCVGDVIPATLESDDGFEVLRIQPLRCLVLGGLYDPENRRQLPFAAPRPAKFWQVTWAFVLEPLDAGTTRLHVRARAAFCSSERLHVAWIRPVHHLMEAAQLRHLAARAEGRLPRDDWRDIASGAGGAAVIAAAFLTSFLRRARSHWGVAADVAARPLPGDELVPEPRWSWTHGIEIAAPAASVWPWIAQIGADRGGFYSYQWLENLAGCEVRNAECVHPEWEVCAGDELRLHPKAPPLRVTEVAPGRWFVAWGAPDGQARSIGKTWAAASWLFHLEALGENRCRLISRYRAACSDDLATRIFYGQAVMEPIGFAMDRRMLLGVKERAERPMRPLRHFDG